jgi:hypothetical protein
VGSTFVVNTVDDDGCCMGSSLRSAMGIEVGLITV